MIDVNDAIKKLVFILNKYSIAGMDSTTLPEDISDETRVKILSSSELHEFYSSLKPSDIKIETGYSPIKIFSLDTIMAVQSGYQSLSDDSLVIADDVIKDDFVNDLRFRVENLIGPSNFDAWFDYLYG